MRYGAGLFMGALGGAIASAVFFFAVAPDPVVEISAGFEEAPLATASDTDRLEKRVAQLEARLDLMLQRTERDDPVPRAARVPEVDAGKTEVNELPDAELVLRTAGVPEGRVDWLLDLSDSISLEGLQAEHEALRGSDLDDSRARRFEARRASREAATARLSQLRGEHGEPLYDWLLYMDGQDNRVEVSTVMRESNAERGGLEPGDVILSYNDERVYRAPELREATQRGELGETVRLEVLRDGRTETIRLERGPMGVQLTGKRVVPDEIP